MQYDAKQVQLLQDECKRLQRAVDAAGGHISTLEEGRRSDHHLILVLRETIADLRKQLAHQKEVTHG